MEQSRIRDRDIKIIAIWVKDGRSQIKAVTVRTNKFNNEDTERIGFGNLGCLSTRGRLRKL